MSIVILRSTGPQNNPKHFTPEYCEQLREADPVAYQTDVLAEFADPESGLLSPVSLRQNTREAPLELLPNEKVFVRGAVDTSEGAATGNPWTLVIVFSFQARADKVEYYQVALAREWRGLRPEACWKEIAACCRRYSLGVLSVDQYAASANADLAKREGLQLEKRPWTPATKLEAFVNLATLIHSDRIELPPERQFRRDLLAVKKRVTQSGETIVLPRTSDGRHCDYAPAFAAAVRAAGKQLRAGRRDYRLLCITRNEFNDD